MDPHYSAAWAWAGATPFQWGKQVGSHLGGTRNPMVVQWPERISDAGELRSQFTHVIDVAPTILVVAGIPEPETVDGIEQEPMHGTSFAASLTDGGAPEHRTQQYFETLGNRGMYKDGWWLGDEDGAHPVGAHSRGPESIRSRSLGPRCRARRSSTTCPTTSRRRRTLPPTIPRRSRSSRTSSGRRPSATRCCHSWRRSRRSSASCLRFPEKTTFEFRGDVQNVMPGMIPRIYNRSYTITADLVVPEEGAEGVIVAEADHLGGFSLYVEDGRLTHTYSMMGVFVFKQVAEEDLPSGEVTVRMEFLADGAKPATGGDVTLFVNDRQVGKGRMDYTVPIRFSGYAGMDIGRDNGGVVDRDYEDKKPFAFTGTVKKVVFDITPAPH